MNTKPSILVIEDDQQFRTLLHEVLSDEGYQVWDAEDGRKGLAKYEVLQPDVVLCDVFMPEMDGLGFLVNSWSAPHKAALIMMSGRLHDGENAYIQEVLPILDEQAILLHKPFDMTELLASIVQVLNDKASSVCRAGRA